MGPISLVELSSRTSREAVLKTLGGDKTTKNTDIGPILFTRAQTSMQRKRNSALGASFDLLKKDPRCRNKIPEIKWKIEGSKNRQVELDGQPIFLQSPGDCSGHFMTPFADLSL